MADGSGAGSDLMDGADGFDTADYSQRTAPLNITDSDAPGGTDANVGNDGEAGENDNVVNIERVIGSSAGDVLSAGGADSVLEGAAGSDRLIGGPGNDNLYGGWAGPDEANGTASADTLGTGNDTFDGGGGADVFHGGDGTDTVTYASRSTPVTVTLDGLPDDGAPGEHDNVLSDIEIVVGGSAADHLAGGSGANSLNGGGGSDTIDGLGGDDVLSGGAGADRITGGTGDDAISGGGGNDTILARDSSPDTIKCGSGVDTVIADPADSVAADCEHALIGPEMPARVSLPASVEFRNGVARLSLGCPKTTLGGCARGRLVLTETAPKQGVLASARFTVAAGDHATVSLIIKSGVLRALRSVKHLGAKLTATAFDANHRSATASRAVQLKLGR
jgi:Ca2+-binding RTX toxin-like protein